MVRILRLAARSELTTARVFEDSFARLAGPLLLDERNVWEFLDHLLGRPGHPLPSGLMSDRFRTIDAQAEFLSVDHHGFHELPRLVAERNRAGAAVRFLVIAHAPAAYGLDWALLDPLLRPGDRVIAPTRQAGETVGLLAPDLARYVRVIGHPVPGSEPIEDRHPAHLLYLGRLVPEKGLSELLDALAGLTNAFPDLVLDIAGAMTGATNSPAKASFVRALRVKAGRLGLTGRVRFHDEVSGRDKARLLAGAASLVNPSVTLEESFGKSIAEALAAGTPAVVTRWDGLPEVLGGCGEIGEVSCDAFGARPDSVSMAGAIARVLHDPPSAARCRDRAQTFSPNRIARAYAAELVTAIDELEAAGPRTEDLPPADLPASPGTGLLSAIAPLTAYGWHEAYDLVSQESDRRRTYRQDSAGRGSPGAILRSLVWQGSRPTLERWYAGYGIPPSPAAPSERIDLRSKGSITQRSSQCIESAADLPSRLSCLQFLGIAGERTSVADGLRTLAAESAWSPGMHYLAVQNRIAVGSDAEALTFALAAFDRSWWGPYAAPLIEQLARLATTHGDASLVLDLVRSWTDDFPDEHQSSRVWLARADCELTASLAEDALVSLAKARALLPDEHVESVPGAGRDR